MAFSFTARGVLVICLLRQFQATKVDELIVHHDHARLHELIALVLLHRSRPLSRQQLAVLNCLGV